MHLFCHVFVFDVSPLTHTQLQRDNAVGTLNYMCAAQGRFIVYISVTIAAAGLLKPWRSRLTAA